MPMLEAPHHIFADSETLNVIVITLRQHLTHTLAAHGRTSNESDDQSGQASQFRGLTM